MPRLAPLLLVTLGAVAAAAGPVRKGPWVQDVTRTSAVVMLELAAPAPAVLRLREIGGGGGPEVVVRGGPATLHELHVAGLRPSRRYAYRVETGGGVTVTGEVATAPLPHEPFSFVVFGDSRSGDEAHRALVERIALEAPDFVLHTGDIVNSGGDVAGWQTFFDIERDLLRSTPVFPAVGNHDREGLLRRTEKYRRYFSLPADAPNPERYYAFTWGNSRFIVLDSNEPSFSLAEQSLWLDEQLAAAVADPEVRHIFAMMHHPLYSTSLHGPNESARLAWAPLFERYRVDLVFAGHDHVYERLARNGVRYITTGGGGAPLYFRHPNPRPVDAASSVVFDPSHHFVRVQVAGDFVEVATVRRDGELIDSFTFGARPAGVCRADSDCDGLAHSPCGGAWRCAGQACEWRCGAAPATPPAAARRAHGPTPPAGRRAAGPWGGGLLWLGLAGVALSLGALGAWRWRRG